MDERTTYEGPALLPDGRFRSVRVRFGARIEAVEVAAPEAGAPPGPASLTGLQVDSSVDGTTPRRETSWLRGSDRVELPGALLLPGFVDGHTHLLGVGLGRTRPDLAPARSKDEALARLSEWLGAHPGAAPVIAEGWDDSTWSRPDPMTGADLDRLTAGRPVAARRVCGHVAAFNREAVALLGPGASGLDAATGVAVEGVAMALTRLWPPDRAALVAAIEAAQTEAFRHGVTGAHEMGDPVSYRAFGLLEAGGRLRMRVSHFFHSDFREAVESAGLVPGQGSDRLRVAGIKIFLDGSLGARSAALRVPYPHGGGSGILTWEDAALARELASAASGGWPVAAHAIGDAAAEQFLNGVEAAREAVHGRSASPSAPSLPLRIEHAEMLPPDLLVRVEQLGVRLSMQPNFTANWQGPGQLYESVLGGDRARSLNPYRAAASTGRLLFGSDTMPLGPLHGIEGALAHPDPEQRLSFAEALRAYGAAAAEAVSHPFHRARLEVGEPADLVLLVDAERSARERTTTRGLSVAATWVDGVVVHAALRGGPGE